MSRMEDLLAGDIQWQLHTTMTIDYAYEAALINKASNLENIAIYYDGNKLQDEINSFSHPVEPELLAKTKLRCFVVTPRSRQTFHAKISLVCFRENNVDKYRLMIYSKNHGFTADSCADIALLFDLIEDDSDSIFINNAKQLNSYINKIIVDTTPEGKNFIVDKGIDMLFSDSKKGIKLHSEEYSDIDNIELLFGGCNNDILWEKITNHGKLKLVLTPAFFVNQSFTDEELEVIKRSKVLYERIGKDDGFPKVSHIKLYLFDDIVYLGSANYTKPGVGYDFFKNTKHHTPSVECLVGLPIDREKSNSLECSIKKYYDSFDGNIGFQHVEDECALYFMKNWKKESIKYYSNLENKTEAKRRGEARHVVVVLKSYNNVNMTIPNCHDLRIALAEYDGKYNGKYNTISSEEQKGDTITLTYDFQKWQYHTGLFILKGFVKGQDNKEKEKRYVWDVGTDGVEEMFILKDSIPKEEFVSDLFLELHDKKEDIYNFQSSEEKYEKNTKMKAFFNAITGI